MNQKTAQAKAYQKTKHLLSLSSLALTFLFLVLFLLTPLSFFLRDAATNISPNHWSVVAIYFTLFSLTMLVVDFPIQFYSGFIIEHRYRLSNLTLGAWLWESFKRHMVGFAFALVLVEFLYFLIREVDEWWLFAWAGWFVVSLLIGQLWPVWIAPLFYKYEKLSDETLRTRIISLVSAVGLRIEDVYAMNLSKTTNKANAYFCGLGKTQRVVLSDTLLRGFTHDEITMVVAHEAGHCKKNHIWKGILFNTIVSLILFRIAYLALIYFTPVLRYSTSADVAGFPLLCLIGMLLGLMMLPVTNGLSRSMEREADRFSLEAGRMREAFASALQKLAVLNLADPDPNPLVEFFLYSHPAISKRVDAVRAHKTA